jgi:hypothetical protein
MLQNFRNVLAASVGFAALLAVSTASADCGAGCRASVPQGLLDYLFTPSACSPCAAPVVEAPVAETPCSSCRPATVYQGDYMVQQRASYSGPAVIAPQPTYAPTPTASGYPYVSSQYETLAQAYSEPSDGSYRVERAAPLRRVVRRAPVHRRHIGVYNERPAKKNAQKGVQVIHARAEVKIYGSKRMDIRLYSH